jgi:hypothetical protein
VVDVGEPAYGAIAHDYSLTFALAGTTAASPRSRAM